MNLLFNHRVSCLCCQLQNVLEHKLKQSSSLNGSSNLKTVRGFYNKQLTFWDFAKKILPFDEIQR